MAPRPVAAVEVHHEIPRNLLGFWDRGHGPGLEPEDLAAWLDWEAEAFRYGVDPDVTRDELAALIDGSTVELPREKHRAIHAAQWAEWGSLGGTETLRRYGTAWFSLLARRRWEQVGAEVPAEVFGVLARGGAGLMAAPLFDLGRVVATPGALELLAATETNPAELLERHVAGDWGEIPREDARENARSLKHGWRVLSSYPVGEDGGKVWIITEADRSSTCILLPEDY